MRFPSSNAAFRPQEISRRRFQEASARAIDSQAHAIGQTREFMADLSARIDQLHIDLNALAAEVALQKARKTWRERLRWIVTGR